MVPGITLHITIYPMLMHAGLLKTMYGPILLYAGTDIIQIWLYLQFLEKISTSLDESAMLEGASYLRIFFTIIIPLMMPAHITVLILKSISTYNDYFVQAIYMNKASLKTVTTALSAFEGNRANLQHVMNAAIVMIMIPTVFVFLVLQKYILSGITAGAIKE
jgi:multiple sugar transport system permease protein